MTGQSSASDRGTPPESHLLILPLLIWLVLFGVTGWILCLLLFAGTDLALPMMLIFVAILILSVNRWTAAPLLIVVQLDLLVREPGQSRPPHFNSPEFLTNLFFVVGVLALLMFVSRYHALLQLPHPPLLRLVRAWLFGASPVNGTGSVQRWPLASAMIAQRAVRLILSTARSLCWLTLLCSAAYIIPRIIPSTRDPQAWTSTTADGKLEIWPGTQVLLALTACWIIVSEFGWRQLTVEQARMYARTLFMQLHYADFRMIVLKQLKHRRRLISQRRAGKLKGSSRPPDSGRQGSETSERK